MNSIEALTPEDVAFNAEPAHEWLATVIRLSLHALVAHIEPPPMSWELIRKRIEASCSAPSFEDETGT